MQAVEKRYRLVSTVPTDARKRAWIYTYTCIIRQETLYPLCHHICVKKLGKDPAAIASLSESSEPSLTDVPLALHARTVSE